MPTDTPLWAAVLADPDSDRPRAVLADRLVESGDPRGELIRVQLKLARGDGDGPMLRRRARALIERHGRQWAGAIADMVEGYRFRRGFVELIELDAAVYLRLATRLHSLAPIRHLTLTSAHSVSGELFSSPHLRRIVSLSLDGCGLDDDDAERLAAAPDLSRLRWLALGRNRIGRRGLDAIAGSPHLGNLQFLAFNDNAAPDPTIRPGGVDGAGEVLDVDVHPLNAELRARYGERPWLTYEGSTTLDWPPDRDI